MTICLGLPMPPSVNELYANVPGKGRVRTKKYRAWQKDADGYYLAQKQRQKAVDGNFTAHIVLNKEKRAGDVDNRGKAVLDALHKRFGITADDKWCDRVTIEWGEIKIEEELPVDCRVYVWSSNGEPAQ